MKNRQNARQKREAEAQRRKGAFSPKGAAPSPEPPEKPAVQKPLFRTETYPDKTPEEDTLEFLDYLDRHGVPAQKDDMPQAKRQKAASSGTLPRLNLEEGMPIVSEALDRMNMGLQEMRCSRVKAVKLIHGYGSTGRGGKICSGVREELAAMKRRKLIKDFIPGEDFGPMDAGARKLAEQDKTVTRDPDYGRMNHGITVVVL